MEKTTVTWRDVGLRERLTVLASAAGVTDTLPALQVLSNASLTTQHTGTVTATAYDPPVTDTYPDLDDTWVITGESSGNYRTQLYVPSALVAAAIADTVNYAAATSEWIAIEAALPAVVVPYDGASIQSLVAGTIARDAFSLYQTWLNYKTADPPTWARRTCQWADVHGVQRLTHLIGIEDSLGADFDTLMAALQAVSAARVTHYWEGLMDVTYNDPTTDQYNSVRDTCVITFRDGTGNLTEVMLPAPARVIFLADGKTLNTGQANVITFIDAAISELIVPSSGAAVVACVGGRLSKQGVY